MGNIATKNMTRCVWLTYPTSITLIKNKGTTIVIRVGEYINWGTVEICISTFNNECSAEAAAMIVVEVAGENDSWADAAKIEVGVPVLNASSEESTARIVVEGAAENAGDNSADNFVEDDAEFVVDPVLSMKRVCNDVEEDGCKRVRGDHSE
jgi:hypothetical protein